jgi:hypothetical protein
MQALPDLSAAYASDNPYQWVQNNPNASPLARAMILNASPLQVAQAKRAGADAGLLQSQIGAFGGAPSIAGPGAPSIGAARGAAPGAAPGVAPAAPSPVAPLAGAEAPAAAPVAAPAFDSMPPPGPARMAWLTRLPPAQKAALLARLSGGGAAPQTAQR